MPCQMCPFPKVALQWERKKCMRYIYTHINYIHIYVCSAHHLRKRVTSNLVWGQMKKSSGNEENLLPAPTWTHSRAIKLHAFTLVDCKNCCLLLFIVHSLHSPHTDLCIMGLGDSLELAAESQKMRRSLYWSLRSRQFLRWRVFVCQPLYDSFLKYRVSLREQFKRNTNCLDSVYWWTKAEG